MTFEREERIAFARIVSDLIEADFIVKENEIETFDKIRSEKDFESNDQKVRNNQQNYLQRETNTQKLKKNK